MTNFLSAIPDSWMLLSIVQQYPNGISSFKLANIATQSEATTCVVNEVRNRMIPHRDANRVKALNNGVGDVIYMTPACTT
jgi:hypothetical protein